MLVGEKERERESTSLMIYVFIIFSIFFLSVLTSGKYDVKISKDEL